MAIGTVLPALCAAVLGSSLVAASGTSGVTNAASHTTSSTLLTHTTPTGATQARSASIPNVSATLNASGTTSSPTTSVETPSTHTTISPSTTSTYTTSPSTSADTTSAVTTPAGCAHCASNSSCDTDTNTTCLHLLCDPVTGSCHGDCEDGWYGDKCDTDQYNETASNITTTSDSGSSLGSMEIAVITLSLLLAASVTVNVIIVVVKIKRKYRKPKGKAMFDLVRNQYSPDRHETIELKAHNAIETLEYQPNTEQPQFQDDEYEDLAVGTQQDGYEVPLRKARVQPDLAMANTRTSAPLMPVPGQRPDTRTSSKVSVESGQRDGNAVLRVQSEETPDQCPLAEPPLPVRPERSSKSKHPELSESPAEVDVNGSEIVVKARDSLALHAKRIGLDISNKRSSGAYTLPDDGASYSVSDIDEAMESEEDPDDGLYENEVVTGDENKKPPDMDDDSDPYENEDFIDTQFRRLKYKYELSPGDGGRVDDDRGDDDDDDPLNGSTSGVDGNEYDDGEWGGNIRKASMTVQYNSNDNLHDIEEEEEEAEEEDEATEDEVWDEESRGRQPGDSNQESDYLNYRSVNGLIVSKDAIIDEGDDYDDGDYDGDDRDLYENEMVWRRNIGGRDVGGVSTQGNLDGQEESFAADVSGINRGRDQKEEDGGFVVDSMQSLNGAGGNINDVEDEKDETDEDVMQDSNVNDVNSDGCYDEAASYDPNMKLQQTDQWETFQSTDKGLERMSSPLDGAPSEAPSLQNELGRGHYDGGQWGDPQKATWPENESPQNGFAENEFTPDKHLHRSRFEDTPTSHQRAVRWTIGDSESSGQTIGDEDLNEWSQALDSDFQQDPRGPVTIFDSDSDEYDV